MFFVETSKEDKAWNIDSILKDFGEVEIKKEKKPKNKAKNNNKDANNNRSTSPKNTTPLIQGHKSKNHLQQQNEYDSTKETKPDNDNSSTEVRKAKAEASDSFNKAEEARTPVIKPEGSNADDKITELKGSNDTTPQPQSDNQNFSSGQKNMDESSERKNSSEKIARRSSGGNNNSQTSVLLQQLLQNSSKQLSNPSEGTFLYVNEIQGTFSNCLWQRPSPTVSSCSSYLWQDLVFS